jgi:hypothetical protein
VDGFANPSLSKGEEVEEEVEQRLRSSVTLTARRP